MKSLLKIFWILEIKYMHWFLCGVSSDWVIFILESNGNCQHWILSHGLFHYVPWVNFCVKTQNAFNFLGSVHSSLLCTLLLVHCLYASVRSEHPSPLPPSFFISISAFPKLQTLPNLLSMAVISNPTGLWELHSYWCVRAPVTSLVLSGWVEAVSEGFLGWPSPTRSRSLAWGQLAHQHSTGKT